MTTDKDTNPFEGVRAEIETVTVQHERDDTEYQVCQLRIGDRIKKFANIDQDHYEQIAHRWNAYEANQQQVDLLSSAYRRAQKHEKRRRIRILADREEIERLRKEVQITADNAAHTSFEWRDELAKKEKEISKLQDCIKELQAISEALNAQFSLLKKALEGDNEN